MSSFLNEIILRENSGKNTLENSEVNSEKKNVNFQGGGKKNPLLTGEVMKEMARQAKILRENRRKGLDSRHRWLFMKVSTFLKVKFRESRM